MPMPIAPHKRPIMTLYSKGADVNGHQIRIVFAEKGVTANILDVDKLPKAKEEMMQLNPYGNMPTLVDRDLVLYHRDIIIEYLDERFPHPPLMPVYPVARARTRLMVHRINRDWYTCLDKIIQCGPGTKTPEILAARKTLREGLMSVVPIFSEMPYFLSEEFSLIDCCMAPLLWRLPSLGIILPAQAKTMLAYAERLFERESFVSSLTDVEQAMRK